MLCGVSPKKTNHKGRERGYPMFSDFYTDAELAQMVSEMIEDENLSYEYCRPLSDEEFDRIF